jgi:dUTP pyrophosphatase
MNGIEASHVDLNEKLARAIDPNDKYSLDDFDKEFGSVNHTLGTDVNQNEGTIPGFNYDIKIKNTSKNETPKYETNGSAGFDFRANLPNEGEVITIGPSGSGNNIAMVPTGLYFELPSIMELQVRPRSGLAAKKSITVLNSPGTVDSDYRGEVKVILINHGTEDFVINNGDRIAQGVISSVFNSDYITLKEVDELSDTERGSGGFGSTGVK